MPKERVPITYANRDKLSREPSKYSMSDAAWYRFGAIYTALRGLTPGRWEKWMREGGKYYF